MQLKRVVRFVIGKKRDRAGACEKPIANTDAGMVQKLRAHAHLSYFEIHRLKIFEFDPSRQIVERDRKEWCRHLALENIPQAAVSSVVTKNPDLILIIVEGNKKWKALDVVPVSVSN